MTHAAILIVNALAVFRLAHLIVEDSIMAPVRQWVGGPFVVVTTGEAVARGRDPAGARYQLSLLLTCMWCISVWIAGLVVLAEALIPDIWIYPAMVLAFSAVTGLLASRS